MAKHMSKLSDDTLEKISHQLDDYFYQVCEENEIPFLQLAALTLARLCVISEDIGESDLLERLLDISLETMNAKQVSQYANGSNQIH